MRFQRLAGVLGFASCLTLILASSEVAHACSYPEPDAFELSPNDNDVDAPLAPRVSIVRVQRGKEPDDSGCSQSSTSCDDLGYVLLRIEPAAAGDRDLGVVLQGNGGPAFSARLLGTPITPDPNGEIRLVWIDGTGETDLGFQLEVWSVDRAGNISTEPTRVKVSSDGSGCSLGGNASSAGWFGLLALTLMARRRRSVRA